MLLPVQSHVDLTPITDRIDAIEGMSPTLKTSVVLLLKHILTHNHAILTYARDGDPFVDETGTEYTWSATLAAQVQAENVSINDLMTALTS